MAGPEETGMTLEQLFAEAKKMERVGAYQGGIDKMLRTGRVAVVITAEEEAEIRASSQAWNWQNTVRGSTLHNATIYGVRIVVAEKEAQG